MMKRLISLLLAALMTAGAAAAVSAADGSSPSSWAEAEVSAAIETGLVPEELQKDYTSPVTRGQVAGMFINLLEKASGKTARELITAHGSEIDGTAFTDTEDEKVFQANALGIIKGTGHNKFSPGGTLKRAQIAAVINRVAAVMGIDTEGFSHQFTDVTGNYAWAYGELGWPVESGIIKGVGSTKFSPGGDLTTEQAILIIYRAYAALTSDSLKIYVAPGGSRDPDGSRKAPFGTLSEAVEAAAAADRTGYGGVEIVMEDGVYPVLEPVSVPSGLGSADHPLTIRGVGNARIVGGAALTADDFVRAEGDIVKYFPEETADKIVMFDLKDYGYTAEDISALMANRNYLGKSILFSCDGELQTLCKYPNDDWVNIVDGWMLDKNGDVTDKTDNDHDPEHEAKQYVIRYGEEHMEHVLSWKSPGTRFVAARLNQLWCTDNTYVLSFDPDEDLMTLPYTGGYNPVKGAVVYWYSIPEELDVPGEYYVSGDGFLYYYPDEGFGNAVFSIPMSDGLLNIDSDHVTVKDLTLTSSRNNGIVIHGDDVTIKGCDVSAINGEYGIRAEGNRITVTGCSVHDCANTAVDVSSGDLATLERGESVISENDIYDFGLLSWPYTKGICIDGAGILVSHNDVHDSKTRAIYWSGAFQTIEYNDVHNVLTASDDIGAISTDDRIQAQNVIRYNYIHDIGAVGALANIKDFNPDYSYMGSAAVYGDFGGSYFEAYGNVICNVNGNGFQVGGRCISIHNNLIVNCSHWYVWDTAIQYSDYYREGKSGSSRHGYPDYIYSPAWKEANPDLASLIMDMAQTEHDDPRAWAAPVGNVIMNNWCHFNKADRYFSNWGVSPYSIEDVIYDFSDEIDVERGQRTNRNVSNYSGKREQPDLEKLITVTAKGFVDMTWEQFQTIGRTGN